METFFYSYSTKVNEFCCNSPAFRTTFNETYFEWRLMLNTEMAIRDGIRILDLRFRGTDAVMMPSVKDVSFSMTPIAKNHTDVNVYEYEVRFNKYHPSCYRMLRYDAMDKNLKVFPDNMYKIFVKISIPRKYFEKTRAAKVVDRFIMPIKIAADLFDQVIGVTKADKLSDMVLTSSDGRNYFCHKFVLSISSDVFKTMFTSSFKCDGEININDIDGETMATILRCIYKNEFDEFKLESPMAEKILYAAEKYNLLELKSKCEARFKFHLDHSNALYHLELAEKYSLESLGLACLKIVQLFEHLMEEEDVAAASTALEMFQRLNIADDAVI